MNTDNLVLRPNCLLTKYPLVFITGPRSLFHYEKLGRDLQDFIAAHGYVVLSPALAFRNKNFRATGLQNWLNKPQAKKFHFIMARDTFTEFKNVISSEIIASTTLIPNDLMKLNLPKKNKPLRYLMHELFCKFSNHKALPYNQTLPYNNLDFFNLFLNHCVELAENED